ncbi:PqqD family peptide modification chaperone [Demequina sp.]|uniref:PqqD family peptide modification chaperone n=1 Tax=Demequina sp. TaxID=2050685 RepID=UPI003D0BD2C3
MIDDSSVVVTTVDDALIRDEQVLVLVGSEVMLLSPVSSEIVRVCAGGMTVGELGPYLERKFGPPPNEATVAAQTAMLVQRLADAGVVHIATSA